MNPMTQPVTAYVIALQRMILSETTFLSFGASLVRRLANQTLAHCDWSSFCMELCSPPFLDHLGGVVKRAGWAQS